METTQAPTAPDVAGRRFDFWLGEWDVTLADGGRATSSVYRDFGDRAVVESFDGRPSSDLQAMTVSTYDPASGCWQLTRIDSDGWHATFTGGFQDGADGGRTWTPLLEAVYRRVL